MEMLPTTFPGIDGSKRLNISMSESESCTIISFKMKVCKWIMLKGQRRSWYFNKSNICDFLKRKKKAKFPYLGQKFKQINLTVSNKSIAGQFVGLHERERERKIKLRYSVWGQGTQSYNSSTIIVCILYAVFFSFHVKQ